MSENMTDTFHRKEMFESNEMSNKGEEASELFELINQLNDDEDNNNNNNSDSNDDNQSSNEENSIESNGNQDSNLNVEEEGKVNINRDELNINVNTNERLINHKNSSNNQAPFESLIKPIQTISISTNGGKTSSIQTFQNRSEKMNLMLLNKSVQKSTNGEGGIVNEEIARSEPKPQQATRIPRIPSLHKKENILNSSVSENTTKAPLQLQSQNVQDTSSSSATTSPTNSLSYKLTHELNKLTQENSRNPRSISKPPGTTSKTSRSMSTNTFDSREDLSEPKFNPDGTRNVKYVVNYKPKQSKVKIFSKKVEIKNVSSKIGSLEKASSYVPSGGNVVIENKPVQWTAKAKIGSLEFAKAYTPSGGNVKIESQKLNWNSQSKIGSLKHADYQPGGGNVKIENHKLNFKQKARPRTDTGLVMIEVNQDSYLSNNASNSSSSGNISQQISPQSN